MAANSMKVRAQLRGDVADVRIVMSQHVPIHFIKFVTVTLNDKTVLESQWSQTISKNPFLGLKIKGAKAGDKLVVSWVDNKDDKDSIQAVVTASAA